MSSEAKEESKEVTFTLEDMYNDLISVSKWSDTVRRVSDNFKENYQIIIELTLGVIGLPIDKTENIFTDEYLEEKRFKDIGDRIDNDDLVTNNLNVTQILKRLWKGVWKVVCGIIKEGSIEERKEYGKSIKLIHEILAGLSPNEIRNIRYGIISVTQVMYENYIVTQKELENQLTIIKKGRKKDKKQEIERIEKAQIHLEKLLNHLKKVILLPRIYDVSRDIRRIVCETILNNFEDEYDEKKKIIDNLLYDDDSTVRKSVVKQIYEEFNNINNNPSDIYIEMGKSLKERIIEMRLDEDIEVSKISIELCSKLDEWGLIKEKERKEMYRMLCDKNSKIRKEAAIYIASFLERHVDKFIKGERKFVIKDKKKLKIVIIIRLIIEIVEKETDLPNFSYFSLEYLVPEFEEFNENIELLIEFIIGNESLALFDKEDSALYEGHENVLFGILYSMVMRGARRQLTGDEIMVKLSASDKKKEIDTFLEVSEAICHHLKEMYEVSTKEENNINWLLRICKYIEKESLKTEGNLNNLKEFLKGVSINIRESGYDMIYNYFELLSEMNTIQHPEIQQIISGIIQEDCRVICNSILDDGMDDESINIDGIKGLIILYHYIKVDPLPLLRERIIKLKNRIEGIQEITEESLIILHILNYLLLWNKINNETNNSFGYNELFELLYSISKISSKDEQKLFELFGIQCEFYFLFNNEIGENKGRMESIIDDLAIECNQKKLFKEPLLEVDYLFNEWPLECLASVLSVVQMNKKVILDLTQIVGKMNNEITNKLKKLLLKQQQINQESTVVMEMETDSIED
ncbi:hypothetical protein, conserved [Entamoeba histolytica]